MQFKTGDRYSEEFTSLSEGPSLEFTHERFNLILRLKNISESEILNFQQSRFNLALFKLDEIVFFLIDVPGVIDWSDAPFSVSTFARECWPPEATNGAGPELKLTVLLIEASDTKIKGVREIRLSEELSDEFLAYVNLQRRNIISPEECLRRIKKIQKKVSPEKMVEKAAIREERG